MYDLLGFVSLLLQAMTWLFWFSFGVWLYFRLRLRSLPWPGAYAVLAVSMSLVTPYLVSAVADRKAVPNDWAFGELLKAIIIGERFLHNLTSLLLAVMVVAEIAGLFARLSPGPDRRVWRLLLAVRDRPIPLGVALLALTLAEPLVLTLLCLFFGPAAPMAQL